MDCLYEPAKYSPPNQPASKPSRLCPSSQSATHHCTRGSIHCLPPRMPNPAHKNHMMCRLSSASKQLLIPEAEFARR